MRRTAWSSIALLLLAGVADAQETIDPGTRLQGRLPEATAHQIAGLIDQARAGGLPAEVLERRALELSAKRVPPEALKPYLEALARRLSDSRERLMAAGIASPDADEVTAAAVALGKGADGPAIAELALSAGMERSLAVRLTVLGGLLDRGLPVGEAMERLEAWPRGRPPAPGAVGLDIAAAALEGARGRGGPPPWVPVPGGSVPPPADPEGPPGPISGPPLGRP